MVQFRFNIKGISLRIGTFLKVCCAVHCRKLNAINWILLSFFATAHRNSLLTVYTNWNREEMKFVNEMKNICFLLIKNIQFKFLIRSLNVWKFHRTISSLWLVQKSKISPSKLHWWQWQSISQHSWHCISNQPKRIHSMRLWTLTSTSNWTQKW